MQDDSLLARGNDGRTFACDRAGRGSLNRAPIEADEAGRVVADKSRGLKRVVALEQADLTKGA
jgi:hypothetical protein